MTADNADWMLVAAMLRRSRSAGVKGCPASKADAAAETTSASNAIPRSASIAGNGRRSGLP